MKKFLFLTAFFTVFIFSNRITAQTSSSYGNLVRIKFDQKAASAGDTLGFWSKTSKKSTNEEMSESSGYFDHISLPNENYLLKYYSYFYENPVMVGFFNENFLDNTRGDSSRVFYSYRGGTRDHVHITPFTFLDPKPLKIRNGFWLLYGENGSAFISNGDILYPFPRSRYEYNESTKLNNRLYTILGEISDKYLGVFSKDEYNCKYPELEYLLVDLSDSPNIDSAKADRIYFVNARDSNYSISPVKIKQFSEDLCFVQNWNNTGLDIYKFTNDTLSFVKKVLANTGFPEHSPGNWVFRNNCLFVDNGSWLASYPFNNTDTTFGQEKMLFKRPFSADRELKYAVKENYEFLTIYDIDKNVFINTISLGGLKLAFPIIVDSPYVFIHQVKHSSSVNVTEKSESVKDFSLSAYPNPFNASAKIYYSLPKDVKIEINVYDMLGRKVRTLVNGLVRKGEHEEIFDASGLPSGVYIYSLNAGDSMMSGKLLLLK